VTTDLSIAATPVKWARIVERGYNERLARGAESQPLGSLRSGKTNPSPEAPYQHRHLTPCGAQRLARKDLPTLDSLGWVSQCRVT